MKENLLTKMLLPKQMQKLNVFIEKKMLQKKKNVYVKRSTTSNGI